jgi:hypothetical protein
MPDASEPVASRASTDGLDSLGTVDLGECSSRRDQDTQLARSAVAAGTIVAATLLVRRALANRPNMRVPVARAGRREPVPLHGD